MRDKFSETHPTPKETAIAVLSFPLIIAFTLAAIFVGLPVISALLLVLGIVK